MPRVDSLNQVVSRQFLCFVFEQLAQREVLSSLWKVWRTKLPGAAHNEKIHVEVALLVPRKHLLRSPRTLDLLLVVNIPPDRFLRWVVLNTSSEKLLNNDFSILDVLLVVVVASTFIWSSAASLLLLVVLLVLLQRSSTLRAATLILVLLLRRFLLYIVSSRSALFDMLFLWSLGRGLLLLLLLLLPRLL